MVKNISLKMLEQKAWRSIFQDGLYDLWLGSLILWLGSMYLLSQYETSFPTRLGISLGIYLISLALLYLGKRMITLPRAGQVRFSQKRKFRMRMVGLVTFLGVAGTLAVLLLIVTSQQGTLGITLSPLASPLLLGLVLLVTFNVPAFILEYRRLHLIGLMFAIPEPAIAISREFFGIQLGFSAFAIPAGVVIIMGLVVFMRFIQEYPIPTMPSSENGND